MFQIKRTQLLVAAALAASSGSVFAVEFSIEGKLTRFFAAATGDEAATGELVKAVECNGARILLKDPTDTDPVKTVYTTPSSANVGKAAFFSTTPFPGFTGTNDVGLRDGTCIIDGNSDASGNLIAETFFGEPAENVLVGPVTSGPGEQFAIMGVPIVVLTGDATHLQDPASTSDPNAGMADPAGRMSASPPVNQFGYPVVLGTVPRDDLSSAEGYLAPDKKFYAFAIETTGGSGRVVADPTTVEPPTPTVQRATLEFRSNTASRIEVRGGCVIGSTATGTAPNRTQAMRLMVDSTVIGTAGTAPVTTWYMPNNVAQSEVGSVDPIPATAATNASCIEDPASPGSGSYRFRVENYTYGGTTRRVAPVNVKLGIPGMKYSAPSVMERIKFP